VRESGSRKPLDYASHFICLDPAIQIRAIEMHSPTFSHHHQFSSVNEMLDSLLGPAYVLRRVLYGQ
jgi:hypothetical protein